MAVSQWNSLKIGVIDRFQRYFSREDEADDDSQSESESEDRSPSMFSKRRNYTQVSTHDDTVQRLQLRLILNQTIFYSRSIIHYVQHC